MAGPPGSRSEGGRPLADAQAGSEPIPLRLSPEAAARTRDASFARAIDDLLMERLAEGDSRALEQLYDRYHVLVYSVALRVVRDEMLAEDIVQEVFLRLWRRPQAFDPARGRLLSWLMSVTRNRAIDEVRRVSRRVRVEDRRPDAADALQSTDRLDAPELAATINSERREVRDALATLPPPQRQVLELAYFEGLTQTEIAERTGAPLGTVKTRTRLAMDRLRQRLGGRS